MTVREAPKREPLPRIEPRKLTPADKRHIAQLSAVAVAAFAFVAWIAATHPPEARVASTRPCDEFNAILARHASSTNSRLEAYERAREIRRALEGVPIAARQELRAIVDRMEASGALNGPALSECTSDGQYPPIVIPDPAELGLPSK